MLPTTRQGILAVRRPDEWTQIDVTVDSGACVSVVPISICEGISILDNDISRGRAAYELANVATIPNLGERRCEVITFGNLQASKITFQVADVHNLCCRYRDVSTWDSIASSQGLGRAHPVREARQSLHGEDVD